MFWSLLATGAAGVLIGVRFRVSALLAASLVAVVVGGTAMQLLGFSHQCTFFRTLALFLTLQGGYLAGLVVTILLRRSAFDRRP